MCIYIYIYNRKIWGKHTHAHAHNNMFVIENYMQIEHRHTKQWILCQVSLSYRRRLG